MMTVKQLIKELIEVDPDLEVFWSMFSENFQERTLSLVNRFENQGNYIVITK